MGFGEGPSRCGGSRCALLCHRKRDISRRCRNQQRGGQSGRLTSECSETTPTWICRYNTGHAPVNPSVCSRPHPDSLRPVAVRWVIASRPGPQPKNFCPYISLLPSRLYVSPLLFDFHLRKNAPLPSLSPFSSVLALSSHLFFLRQTRFRVRPSPHERPSVAF